MENDVVQKLNRQLDEYKRQKYNIPGTTQIGEVSPLVRPELVRVDLDTNPDRGDIRHLSAGKFEVTAQGLQRFKSAARIEFTKPKIESLSPTHVMAFTEALRLDLSGKKQSHPGSKSIDLKSYEEAFRITTTQKVKKRGWDENRKRSYVEEQVRTHIAKKKQYAYEQAVTGAENRAIIKALGLKKSYKMDELKKPFIVLAVSPNIEGLDAEGRRAVHLAMMGIAADYYQTGKGISDNGHDAPSHVSKHVEPPEEAGEFTESGTPSVGTDGFEEYPRSVRERIVAQIIEKRGLPEVDLHVMGLDELSEFYGKLAAT